MRSMRLITYMVTRIGVRDPIEYGHATTLDTAVGWLQQKNKESYDQVQKVPGAIVDTYLILNVLEITAEEGGMIEDFTTGVIIPLYAKYAGS